MTSFFEAYASDEGLYDYGTIGTPESSVIRFFGYEPRRQMLDVAFVGGGFYCFFNVPIQVVLDFASSPTKNWFYNTHIKHNYPTRKIG